MSALARDFCSIGIIFTGLTAVFTVVRGRARASWMRALAVAVSVHGNPPRVGLEIIDAKNRRRSGRAVAKLFFGGQPPDQ